MYEALFGELIQWLPNFLRLQGVVFLQVVHAPVIRSNEDDTYRSAASNHRNGHFHRSDPCVTLLYFPWGHGGGYMSSADEETRPTEL